MIWPRNHRNVFPFNLKLINTLAISSCKLYVLPQQLDLFFPCSERIAGILKFNREIRRRCYNIDACTRISSAINGLNGKIWSRFTDSSIRQLPILFPTKPFSRRSKSSPRCTWSGISSTMKWSRPARFELPTDNLVNSCCSPLLSPSLRIVLNTRIDPQQSND